MRLERQADLLGRDRPLKHLRLSPGMKFLDAGCGSGWVARRVAKQHSNIDVIGTDLTPAYVSDASAFARAEGLSNVAFVVGDVQQLPFEDATFDVTWSQFVLYFVPDSLLAPNYRNEGRYLRQNLQARANSKLPPDRILSNTTARLWIDSDILTRKSLKRLKSTCKR